MVNGNGASDFQGPSMARRVRQPAFEREILDPGLDILEAITKTYLEDELAVVKTARYINKMLMFNKNGKFNDRIKSALIKINGLRSIKYRSTKSAVQAHGGLFWDSDASDKDKKHLVQLQDRDRRDNDEPKRDGG